MKLVVSCASIHIIVAGQAIRYKSIAAKDTVITLSAQNNIVAFAAPRFVVTTLQVDNIIAAFTKREVIARSGVNDVVPLVVIVVIKAVLAKGVSVALFFVKYAISISPVPKPEFV